jgi:signal peptidase I
MTKAKTGTKAAAKSPPSGGSTWSHTLRETVESIVLALILAFLFRTFEAEAFVIPTGSMAPTLQGRHKDIRCPKCGYEYRTGASKEVDESGHSVNCDLVQAICPMCGYTVDVGPAGGHDAEYPSYNGDRIIVNKFAYDISNPERWDVVVFKYPGDAKTNYIKRLVGLPNERVRIQYGDIYTAPLNSEKFQIARKSPQKVRAMLQPVYDNDYVVPELIQAGMPPRWQPWAAPGRETAWKTSPDFKSFEIDGQSPAPAWLRYQHFLPTDLNWEQVQAGRKVIPPQPSEIRDYYAFNAGTYSCNTRGGDMSHWVGDLAVDCQLEVKNNQGTFTLELVKGGVQFISRIDVASGQASLSISSLPDFAPTAQTPIRGPGKYKVSFANVDERLLLWVNGELMSFDKPTEYPNLPNTEAIDTLPVLGSNQVTDKSPVGVAASGGLSAKIDHLKIWRDIYYISDASGIAGDFTDPKTHSFDIELDPDEFFMLGDNSPESSDGRYWRSQNYVDRRLLIGKALFVYWPHSFNYVELGEKKIPFPFWPNYQRMRFVH